MSGGAEAGDLLQSLGVAAVDASAVEKDLWVQVAARQTAAVPARA